MKRYAGAIVAVLLCLTLGCARSESRSEAPSEESMAAQAPARTMATGASDAPVPGTPATPAAPASSRMIIRTASLSMVVTDATVTAQQVTAEVTRLNGFVTESRQWRQDDQIRAHLTLRVPAERLDQMIVSLRSQAVRVESESVTGQDVSEEYSDLGAQLRNLEAAENELRELLVTVRQRVQKAADILEVYNELTRVRGEIERIKGRMKYLSDLTALSTVNLELIPDALAQPVVAPGWRPFGVVLEATRSLVSALKFIAESAIWVVIYIFPIGAILVMVFLVLRRLFRGRRSRNQPASPASE